MIRLSTISKFLKFGSSFVSVENNQIQPPTLSTNNIMFITSSDALVDGNVLTNGGGIVSSRGVVYSESANPTISDNSVLSGSGTGNYFTYLIGLTASTTYYVRTYAINETGITYGNELTFDTL